MGDPSPSLPPGYLLRAATQADVPAVAALRRAIDLERYDASDITEAEVIEEFSQPRLDLRSDAWIVEAPGAGVAAYGIYWLENPPGEAIAEQVVHPAHRGRGLSHALLELAASRAVATAAATGHPLSFGVFTDEKDTGRRELFARHGFVLARQFLRMELVLDVPPPAPAWPPGIQVRGFRRGRDEDAVHAAMEEAFLDHFRPGRMSLDEWLKLRFDRPDLDLGLWWVAWDGGEVAGSVLAFSLPTGAYIDELGVRRPWRGRGLGRALLQHAFGGLYARGQRRMFLGVDSTNPTGALRIYESVGMKPSRRHLFFEKTVAP